ncbi:hypothetical protein BVX94_02535, partial [bacterium B17]
ESGGTKGLPFDIHLKEFVVERHAPSADIHPPQEVLVAFNRTREPVSQVPVELNGDQYVVGSVSGKEVYTRILRREPDFSVNMETREVISRSEELNNPALLLEMSTESVTNKIWVFANHPGMPMLASGKPTDETSAFVMVYDLHYTSDPRGKIKEFRSSLQIMEHGVSVAEKTIVVNSPMKYKGYSIYQSGYDKDRESWSQLQIVKDPGVPLVYTGFVLMLAGLSMVFYLKPLKTGK